MLTPLLPIDAHPFCFRPIEANVHYKHKRIIRISVWQAKKTGERQTTFYLTFPTYFYILNAQHRSSDVSAITVNLVDANMELDAL